MALEQILVLVECNFDAMQSMNIMKYEVSRFTQCPMQSYCNDDGSTASDHTIQSTKYESAKAECTALEYYCSQPNRAAFKEEALIKLSFKYVTPLDLLPPECPNSYSLTYHGKPQ